MKKGISIMVVKYRALGYLVSILVHLQEVAVFAIGSFNVMIVNKFFVFHPYSKVLVFFFFGNVNFSYERIPN